MATMKQNHNYSPLVAKNPKLVTLKMDIHKLISNFVIFASGLALGVAISFYPKTLPDLNATVQFNYKSTWNTPTTRLFSQPKPTISPSPSPQPAISIPTTPITTPTRIGLSEFLKPPVLIHDMDDEELLWRASIAPSVKEFPFEFTPKVAFMFLVKEGVILAPLWDMFFRGHQGKFSIYIHPDPSLNETVYSRDSAFYGRSIPSKEVRWGYPNMIEAERRLLANALLDMSNQRFVLLSETCIPLFNFTTAYDYLIGSNETFVQVFDSPARLARGRYRPKMWPLIRLDQWRKGSQWFELDRAIALQVVSDRKYFPLFTRYCFPTCYSDEHYLPTFVTIAFASRNSNRTLTWVDWSRSGPHPRSYVRPSVTAELLESLRHGSKCDHNGERTNVCHLFARKFMPNTLGRLMRFAPNILQFN